MTGEALGRVRLEVHAGVATVTLDRPAKLNALTLPMLEELERVLAEVDRSVDVRALVLATAGDRVFCAGADITHFRQLTALDMWQTWTRRGHQAFQRLAELRQPTVAAIDGNAFGGGLEVVLACDLRVLAEDAVVGLTEVGLGTVPGWGGTVRLPQLIGVGRAKQMVLTGRPVDAATCLEWGLVNETTRRTDVLAHARALAEHIAGHAPVATQAAKQAIDNGSATLEGLAGAVTGGTADFREGLAAFVERREPRFEGH